MKVAQILGEPLAVQRDGTKAQQMKRVYELLASVGLDRMAADGTPRVLRRSAPAHRLRAGPGPQSPVIVADEPVSALDVSVQAQILNLMKELQREHHLSYVMVSHDLAVIYYMADTIAVMYLGKIVEIGDAESVFRPRRILHPGPLGRGARAGPL